MAATVKDPSMKANIPFIPNDVMANIFKRLPVRSLTRFQCVCKCWKNLIKDLIKTPSFVQDHLHHTSYTNPSLLLEQYHPRFLGVRLSVLDRDMRVAKVQELPSTHSSFNYEVVGSSNGLVCLRMVEDGKHTCPLLVIWNPSTREIRDVRPRAIIYPDLIDEDLGFRAYCESQLVDYLGFGFSPLDNDYKIVRINGFHPWDIKAVQVYSLNHGLWKEIEFGDDLKGITMSDTNVTINGIMLWDTTWLDDEPFMLSIDLSKEVCTVNIMPHFTLYIRLPSFIEYENKLAAVACVEGEDESDWFHLWVISMEKYKYASGEWERLEWTKIYTYKPCPCQSLRPMTIWRNEIVLLPFAENENDGQTTILYLLNLTTHEFKRLDVRAYPYDFGQLQIMKGRPFSHNTRNIEIDIFNYVESFVSVDGRR